MILANRKEIETLLQSVATPAVGNHLTILIAHSADASNQHPRTLAIAQDDRMAHPRLFIMWFKRSYPDNVNVRPGWRLFMDWDIDSPAKVDHLPYTSGPHWKGKVNPEIENAS